MNKEIISVLKRISMFLLLHPTIIQSQIPDAAVQYAINKVMVYSLVLDLMDMLVVSITIRKSAIES